MATDNMTFREAYGILQEHAENLRNQNEPNIDDLLSIVEESVGAYRVCKERIDAVEKALEKALTDVAEPVPRPLADEGAARPAPPARVPRAVPAQAPVAKSGFDDIEDDIPF